MLLSTLQTGADRNKVFHYHPFNNPRECISDLSKTRNKTVYAEPVCIPTVALSTGEYYCGICVFGDFDGEYAPRNMLHDAEDRLVVVGYAMRAPYGIGYLRTAISTTQSWLATATKSVFWTSRQIHSSVTREATLVPLFARASSGHCIHGR
jgi:hypothetical protein